MRAVNIMRKGEKQRCTKETSVTVSMNLDGSGKYEIDTGVGFFDHMLELFSCHSGIDLTVKCSGDVKVDGHHSVEDIGITMGKLLCELMGDKRGIARYATSYIPMDESLARTVIDVSGRPFLVFDGGTMSGKVGDFDVELIEEFIRAVSTYGMLTVHTKVLYGGNQHHMAEAAIKSFAHALKDAIKIIGKSIPSSKGILE